MSVFDEAYVELRSVPVDQWSLWLDDHEVDVSRFHWWLALLERLETDLSQLANGAEGDFMTTAKFVVEVLDFAVASGAWRPPFAGGMLCRYARLIASSPHLAQVISIPYDLTIDGAARRTLDSFELSVGEAVDLAHRAFASRDNAMVPAGWRSLQDIQWALDHLKGLAGRIHDRALADRSVEWLNVEPVLNQ